MEAVIHVINNRVKSDYQNFGKMNCFGCFITKNWWRMYQFTGLEISGKKEGMNEMQLSEMVSNT